MAEILGSWKEIAAFFGRSVRTVQRWEKTHGLPVSRPSGASSKIVFAASHDLEVWLRRNGDPDSGREANKVVLMVCGRTAARLELRGALEDAGYLVISCADCRRAEEILLNGLRVNLLLTETASVVPSGSVGDGLGELAMLPVVQICVAEEDYSADVKRTNWRALCEPVEAERLLGAVDELLWV